MCQIILTEIKNKNAYYYCKLLFFIAFLMKLSHFTDMRITIIFYSVKTYTLKAAA